MSCHRDDVRVALTALKTERLGDPSRQGHKTREKALEDMEAEADNTLHHSGLGDVGRESRRDVVFCVFLVVSPPCYTVTPYTFRPACWGWTRDAYRYLVFIAPSHNKPNAYCAIGVFLLGFAAMPLVKMFCQFVSFFLP